MNTDDASRTAALQAHRIEMLAQAIVNIGKAAGMWDPGPMTGPQTMLYADEVVARVSELHDTKGSNR